jgi:hypothetical protein
VDVAREMIDCVNRADNTQEALDAVGAGSSS